MLEFKTMLLFFVFFNIWVQETMWRKIEGNPASELPWEQSSWSLKTRSAAGVCVCGQWHASFCVLVWILFCCFSAVFAKSVCLYQHVFVRCHKLVSHCKNFQLPSAYLFFFSYSWIVSHGSQSVWKSFTPDLSVIIFFFLCYNNID